MGAIPEYSGIWILVSFSANGSHGGRIEEWLVEAFVRLVLLRCAAVGS